KLLISSLLEFTTFEAKDFEAIEAAMQPGLQKNDPIEAPPAAEPDGPIHVPKPAPPADPVIHGQRINDKITIFIAPAEKATATMEGGRTDIIIFNDHDVRVSNFIFGEDFIFANGSLETSKWIKDIEVIDDDVIITGINGGRITLIDAFPTIA
ncbi:MAG: hypothetical protein ACRC7C_00890, partial [Beijerinckiaceae bacterium]